MTYEELQKIRKTEDLTTTYLKEESNNLLKEHILGLPAIVQVEKLESIINEAKAMRKTIMNNLNHCFACKKYFKPIDLISETVKEIRNEIVTHGNTANDDTIGDVEYLVEYNFCTECGARYETKRSRLNVLREKRVWDMRYEAGI